MADRKCPECNEPVWTAVGPCQDCAIQPVGRNANLHQNANSKCKMTYAERMTITSRKPGKDGKWRPDPKWRDSSNVY